jgi:CRISPR-associated protein Csx3
MKVVLCGPPRSGKSCLREALKQAVRAVPGAPYPYIITACPDGEGAWFQATVENDPAVAAAAKAAYKSAFTPAFVRRVADSVRQCALPLTLIDIGGIPSGENEDICAGATHAIILAGDKEKVPVWREFCAKVNLVVIAEVTSDYHGTQDVVPVRDEDGVWRGSVHHLERGDRAEERPTVKALAALLVDMVKEETATS